jgi:hypothetical protein
MTNDRPDLSSERAPHIDRTVTFNQNTRKHLVMCPRRARRTDWLSVVKWLWLWLKNWAIPCRGGVQCLHYSPASRRRQRKRNSRIWDSKGVRTRKWTSWRGPAAIVNDKPVLLSERASYVNKSQLPNNNKNLVVSPRWVLYSKTDWPTDRRL